MGVDVDGKHTARRRDHSDFAEGGRECGEKFLGVLY